jgi:hypothetical protein
MIPENASIVDEQLLSQVGMDKCIVNMFMYGLYILSNFLIV